MLDDLLNNDEFALLMHKHIYECIDFLLKNNLPFSVTVNLSLVNFAPELPSDIKDKFNMPVILFALNGYTFKSANLSQDSLKFEAGFGEDDFASVVSLPLGAVVQILVENSPILINFAIYKDKKANNAQKSLSAFLKNPKNRDLFDKK